MMTEGSQSMLLEKVKKLYPDEIFYLLMAAIRNIGNIPEMSVRRS